MRNQNIDRRNVGDNAKVHTQIVITFPDKTIAYGNTATKLLQSLLGGWNPNTVPELRQAFLRRAGCHLSSQALGTDLEFLRFCSIAPLGLWTIRENVEQPFGVHRTSGASWTVNARSGKTIAVAL